MRLLERNAVSDLKTIFLVLLVSLCSLGVASAETDDNLNWQVRVWRKPTPGDDMALKGLAQTSDGFLWFATKLKLVRFDGVDFEGFKVSDLVTNAGVINCLMKAHDGAMWLTTANGLLVRLESGQVQSFTNTAGRAALRNLVEDRDGALWMPSDDGSVYRFKEGRFTRFDEHDGLPGRFSPHLAADGSGRIWFAGSSKVGVFRNGRFESQLTLGSRVRTQIAACRSGGIWICKDNELLKYSEGSAPQSVGSFSTSAPCRPSVVLEDQDGTVWIGTQDAGLFHQDGHGFENVPTSHSDIVNLFEDCKGNLWVGTPEGLDQVMRRPVVVEGSSAISPSRAVGSLCEDTAGNLWAAMKDGRLARRVGNGWRAFSVDGTNEVTGVTRIAAGSAGDVWIGTRDARLLHWKDGKLTSLNSSNGLSSQRIASLYAGNKGEVWAAGRQPPELIHVSGDRVETIRLATNSGFLRTIVQDGDGAMWFGGDQSTFFRYRDGAISNAVQMIPRMTPFIRCLCVADGSLWIAAADTGVGRLKNGQFSLITNNQGLYNNDIRQMVADDRGWLWFGSAHGIFKVRLEELNAVAEGRARHLQSVHYGRESDLPELEAGVDDSGSAIRTRDGRLWIPMGMALAVIDPAKLRDDPDRPPVLVKSILADGKIIASYDGLISTNKNAADLAGGGFQFSLRPDHRRLEFRFTALNYEAAENVTFRYLLEGLDHQWIRNGTRRDATYPRLPAGDYRFRVQAYDSTGGWTEAGTGIAFNVTPFFWQTWWFRALALAAFAAVVASVMRLISFRRLQSRLKELEYQTAIERERSRIARDLHDDLGSGVTHILFLNELALRNRVAPSELPSHARKIADTARDLAQSLDEAVWAINPRNDGSPHLIEYLGQYAIEFLKAANVRCRLDFPEELPLQKAPADVRYNLLYATKEALNNAVKHGRPAEVRLQVEVTEEIFRLTIQDDGAGFYMNGSLPDGNGLENMRERLEKIDGKFEMRSRPGEGTTVIFTMPWNRVHNGEVSDSMR